MAGACALLVDGEAVDAIAPLHLTRVEAKVPTQPLRQRDGNHVSPRWQATSDRKLFLEHSGAGCLVEDLQDRRRRGSDVDRHGGRLVRYKAHTGKREVRVAPDCVEGKVLSLQAQVPDVVTVAGVLQKLPGLQQLRCLGVEVSHPL